MPKFIIALPWYRPVCFCLTAQAKQSKVIAIKCLLTFLSAIYHQVSSRCSQTKSKASTSKGTELCNTTATTHGSKPSLRDGLTTRRRKGSRWKGCLALSALGLGAGTLSPSAADGTLDCARFLFVPGVIPMVAVVFLLLHYSWVERGNKTDENTLSFQDSSSFEVLMELYSSLLYLLPHQNEKRGAAN